MFRAQTAQNVVILVGLQWFNRILAIVVKIVLVRLLFPADFGVFTLAYGLIGFLSTFGAFGLDYAIVQKGDAATEDDYDVAMSYRLVISLALFFASVAVAWPWAILYNNLSVAPTSAVLAILYLVTPFSFVPATRLTRELRYRAIAIPTIASQLTNAILSIGLAALGFGVWALVYGTLVGQVVATVAYSALRSWRYRFSLRRATAKPLLGYGKHIIAAALLGFLITNMDNFAVGFFWGTALLGIYSVAYAFGTIPGQLVSGPAGSALFPSLARLQNDLDALRQGYLETFGYVMSVAVPASIGLAVVAPELVSILFGPGWADTTLPLIILAFYGLARAPIDFSTSIFAAVGRPRIISELYLYTFIASLLPLFPLTILYGINGAAVAMTVPMGLVCIVTILRSARVLRASVRDFYRRILGPLLAAEAMGALIYALRVTMYSLLPSRIPIPFTGVDISEVTLVLVVAVSVGIAVYFVLLRLIDRRLFEGLVHNLRLALGPVGASP